MLTIAKQNRIINKSTAALVGATRRFFSDEASFDYLPRDWLDTTITRSRGLDVLHDPIFNKGTGHPLVERERLGLRGLLPPRVLSMEQQMERMVDRYSHGASMLTPEEIAGGGISEEHVRKWLVLQEVQDRNETLFYRMLAENFLEMAPIIYTPTVGHVCRNYHKLYRRPRGMFFSAADRGEMACMAYNWPSDAVDAIVVTDGSRILGLGDLGANGLGIPIGKLDLYVAAGGFNPRRVLPCVIDVGTDNEALRNDPWYMGLRQPRLTGDAYYEVMDEFVTAVMGRWPSAVLQFEDFNIHHAAPLLERYRHAHCAFNDDIQGTAATAVAGLLGAMASLGRDASALTEQRVVVLGAGSAGLGVTRMIALGMVRHGLSEEEAATRFHVLDNQGLVTASRPGLHRTVAPFARKDAESRDGESLVDVVKRVKPTALIGLSGAGRLFTHDVLRLMGEYNERPIIMPMSNPTSQMECTHEEAQVACQGRAIFACGSPQPNVDMGNGKIAYASQANNMYIFPGLALGAFLARGNIVSDHMIMAAAEALPGTLSSLDLAAGRVYPGMDCIRAISLHIATEVIKAAADEGHVANPGVLRALGKGDEFVRRYVSSHMYWPAYTSLVPPGPAPPGPRMHLI